MTEIYMLLNNMNSSIVWEFHEKHVAYDLRKKNLCKLPKANTTSFGVESLSFKGSVLWNTLDDNIKQEPTLVRFEIGPENIAPAEHAANNTGHATSFYLDVWFCTYAGWSKLVFTNTSLCKPT